MPNNLSATLFLAAMLSLFCVRPGLAADAGEVLTFNGDCYVTAAGGQRTALKMGDPVHVGDVLDVPQGAKLKLRMADGSILSLASGTHLTIQSYTVDPATNKRDAKLSLDTGLIRAVVAKVSEPSTFEVDTATSVAAARSTDWFDQTDPDNTRVGVLEGSVEFAALGAKGQPAAGGVVIAGGEGSTIASAPTAAPPAAPAAGTKAGAHRAAPAPKLAPTPPKPWTKAQFDQLVDLTSVSFGWCQCIGDTTGIHATCQSSVDNCKASCGNGLYSYIPDARQSCGKYYGEAPVPGH